MRAGEGAADGAAVLPVLRRCSRSACRCRATPQPDKLSRLRARQKPAARDAQPARRSRSSCRAARVLRGGDLLRGDRRARGRVVAAAEKLLHDRLRTPRRWRASPTTSATATCRCRSAQGFLRIAEDHVLAEMAARAGRARVARRGAVRARGRRLRPPARRDGPRRRSTTSMAARRSTPAHDPGHACSPDCALVRLLQLASPRCRSAPTAIRRAWRLRSRRGRARREHSAQRLDRRRARALGRAHGSAACCAAADGRGDAAAQALERRVPRQPRDRRAARRDAADGTVAGAAAGRSGRRRCRDRGAGRSPTRVRAARLRALAASSRTQALLGLPAGPGSRTRCWRRSRRCRSARSRGRRCCSSLGDRLAARWRRRDAATTTTWTNFAPGLALACRPGTKRNTRGCSAHEATAR